MNYVSFDLNIWVFKNAQYSGRKSGVKVQRWKIQNLGDFVKGTEDWSHGKDTQKLCNLKLESQPRVLQVSETSVETVNYFQDTIFPRLLQLACQVRCKNYFPASPSRTSHMSLPFTFIMLTVVLLLFRSNIVRSTTFYNEALPDIGFCYSLAQMVSW